MFDGAKVGQLKELEILVFEQVLKEPENVSRMTIRDFAAKTHVSPATIIRMAEKLGFAGWSDLKYQLNQEQLKEQSQEEGHYNNMLEFELFLKRMHTTSYQKQLNFAAKTIARSDYTLFIGQGNSASLSDYGTKYFVNSGLKSFSITDTYQAIQVYGTGNVVAIVLSESGKTQQVLNKVIELKEAGAKLISVTNTNKNPIAQLADCSLSYNLMEEWSKIYPLGNLTTQLPTLAIIEILAHKAISLTKKSS